MRLGESLRSMSTVFPLNASDNGGGNDGSVRSLDAFSEAGCIGKRFRVTDYLFSKWYLCLIPVALALLVLPFEIVYTLATTRWCCCR